MADRLPPKRRTIKLPLTPVHNEAKHAWYGGEAGSNSFYGCSDAPEEIHFSFEADAPKLAPEMRTAAFSDGYYRKGFCYSFDEWPNAVYIIPADAPSADIGDAVREVRLVRVENADA